MPDSQGRPLHFDGGKPAASGEGMHAAYRHLHRATGKTIARVRFGDDVSIDDHTHQSEYVVFELTDGSALEIMLGSNGYRFMNEYPGFKASDLQCHVVALYQEDGVTQH